MSFRRFCRVVSVRLLRFPKQEEGAVMVEFLIVAPIYVFLVLGCVQFMGISHADAMLQYANFMAVRTGAVQYEPIMEGFDPRSRQASDEEKRWQVTQVMRGSAAHALGPLYRRSLGESLTAPINAFAEWFSGNFIDAPPPLVTPVLVDGVTATQMLEPRRNPFRNSLAVVRVQWGVVDVEDDSPHLPRWIYAQTEVDLRLGVPYAGAIIANSYQAATNTLIAGNQEAFDEWASTSIGVNPLVVEEGGFLSNVVGRGPVEMLRDELAGGPRIRLRSDATLNVRNPQSSASATQRWIPWPISEISPAAVGSRSNYDVARWETNQTQPAAMPVHARLRNSPR